MTTNGDPYQNAIAERINGILKQEFGLGRYFNSDAEMRRTLRQAIEIYNHERPHASCQYLTPEQAHEKRGPLKHFWSKKKYKPVNII
jgi:transposase InsO family protein